MIREYAPSLSNRGHFLTENEVSKMKGGKDKFMSLFCYDESVKEYVKEKGKIAGYKGIIYLSGEHIIDISVVEDFIYLSQVKVLNGNHMKTYINMLKMLLQLKIYSNMLILL